jgi:anaerobic sulfite reductase subunit B
MAMSALTADSTEPLAPSPFLVRRRTRQSHDTVTLTLEAIERQAPEWVPGQFNMVYAAGVGEVPISMSDRVVPSGRVEHTIRAVGAVTEALCRARVGEVVGIRGPFGTGWGCTEAEGADLVLVAGGIGLAPLRSALRHALDRRDHYGRLALLVGARTPEELVFRRELTALESRHDIEVLVTVDRATSSWRGEVGVVTTLVPRLHLDASNTIALVCGPEVMMRFAAAALMDCGLTPDRIRVSLERNMQCGIGWCGHCQLGPMFVCTDGPVVSYDRAAPLLAVRER